MIPQDTIQQIIQAADVVEVIGDFVSLKKRGASMIACCPFHNEKTPSFYVSPAKQIYKCFGCGKGGDSVRFVMDLESLSYPDALKWLAKKYNIEIKEKEFTDQDLIQQNEKDSLYIVTEFAKNFYASYLNENEEGQSVGQSYFKERGFSKATIQKFELGFSPDSWDTFTKHALKNGFSLDILEKAGLTIQKEGKDPIDRFRGRVIFPVHNVPGKTIAFGARILKPDPKAPKYLNSPETEIYHKSKVVYGIYQAKNAIRQQDNCFLVEGYTDVISLHQAGIENVVASSGTSLTKEQIQLIRRFTPNITVLYDGDTAGIKASLRGIDIILEEDMNVKSVVFPDGDDPDSYIRKVGGESFISYVNQTGKDFIRFKTEISLADAGNDPIKKAGLITDLVDTITKIPNPIKRSVFYKEVSTLLQIDENILINEGNKLIRNKSNHQRKDNRNQPQGVPDELPPDFFMPVDPSEYLQQEVKETTPTKNHQEEALVRDLIAYGHVIIEKDEENGQEFTLADYLFHETADITFETPVYVKIIETYKSFYDQGQLPPTTTFSSHPDEEIQKTVINWLASEHELSENWHKFEIFIPKYEDLLHLLSFKMILRTRIKILENKYKEMMAELAESSEDDQDVIISELDKIKKKIIPLSKELGSVF